MKTPCFIAAMGLAALVAACSRSGDQRVDTTLPDNNTTVATQLATDTNTTVTATSPADAIASAEPDTTAPAAEGSASGSPPQAATGTGEITQPDWIRKPTGEDLARYYPEGAARSNIGGNATISCAVTEEGSLTNCSVTDEEPTDEGFGDAAMRMSRLFKMSPMTRDGSPVSGGNVRIPIHFNPRPQ